jgi:outer membrane protein
MNFKQLVIGSILTLSAAIAAAEAEIAVIDFQRVLFQSVAAQDATQALQPEISAVKQRIGEIETRINALQNALEIDAATLTEADLLAKQGEIQQLVNERAKAIQFGQQKQNNSRNEFVAAYKGQVQEVVATLSKARGFNLVIDLSTVVYVDGMANITDDVLVAFDNQYKETRTVIEP